MTQVKAPQREKFYYANILSKIQIVLIIIGSILSLITLFVPNKIVYYINILICIISLLYLGIELVFPYIYQKANEDKIKDLIDKSFDSKLSDKNSENYYTNDEIKNGLPKLGANNFESVFFTKNIVRKMIKNNMICFILVILIYLVSIFFVEKSSLVVILQLLLPIHIIKEVVYLWLFYCSLKEIYENYKKVYTSIKKIERTPHIIQNIVLYEKLLSNYKILTSSMVYRKMNKELSNEWEKLKIKYDIINK